MSYAQTNYSQLQGMTVNGVHPRYSIHDIGCFITSFCNLEARFGRPIAPDQLDNALAAKKLYIDIDDGVYDDVAWTTICAYDPQITVSRTGEGLPPSSNCIVKFVYNSFQTGNPTTHFCLVNDVNAKTIIDSWDGQVKSWNAYPGGPQEWAEYVEAKPQPVAPAQGENMAMDATFVTNMYRYVAGREPSASEVNFQVASGNPASLLNAFISNGDLATKRLGDQIASLQAQLNTQAQTVSTLQASVADLNTKLAAAESSNTTLTQTASSRAAKVDELNGVVTNLQKQIKSLNTELAAHGSDKVISVKQAVQVLVNAFKAWIK